MTAQTWEAGYKTGWEEGYKAGLISIVQTNPPQKGAVLAFVKANPGLRSAQISEKTGIVHASVRTALYRLLASGAVKTDSGRWLPADEHINAR